jgi:hypothetical protein
VPASELVFADGDRVGGSGRLVVAADGTWLDLTVVAAVPSPADWYEPGRSVRLVGAENAATTQHDRAPDARVRVTRPGSPERSGWSD